ncbi:NADH-ubiquinone oxidoreductase-F iron-sulfur binding region domain-containing protein [Nostocoides sp. F2B08]|uniref:NADH-ubiquinone oxidoreductase-F iron-sulfur binding region domain-containing protein n=1 Tax=Nostocoides sp. F2B08 TaxID=2653936 RepID=UPI00186B4C23|nr:NADH-ubiquinone oxidoreductase-F iron-sulfur binding region domain-containing protein [Tetrasphaera sp. F2B08]
MIRPPALVDVAPGPLLLSGLGGGPGSAAHLSRFGPLPDPDADHLLAQFAPLAVRGRGGAGFPMARKLETVLERRSSLPGRRPVVVVNAAEGEPASAKDTALLEVAPHLVLDGAVLAARAIGARSIHVVTAADRQWAGTAVTTAIADRQDRGVRWQWHEAEPRFVSGQARAVLELIAGRTGLPVTSWAPEAVDGHRGRPTLLSNAESFAHLAAIVRWGAERYASHGTAAEPGTTLLTLTTPPQSDGRFAGVRVVEVEHGAPAGSVLGDEALRAPLLIGGFHGSWVHPDDVADVRWSNAHLRRVGASLGAGSVLSLATGACPVAETARYTAYLAAETAGRCGPCRNGLPALAREVEALAHGVDSRPRIEELTGLVRGRGACAHPDGTARLVASLLTTLDDHVEAHLRQRCSCHADLAVEAL